MTNYAHFYSGDESEAVESVAFTIPVDDCLKHKEARRMEKRVAKSNCL